MEGNAWVRDPFPGNTIPQNRFDPVARNVIDQQFWKQQTDPGDITPNGPNNNLTIPAFGAYDFQGYDAKIDHQFSSMHKIFGRYSRVRHRNEDRPVRQLRDDIAAEFGSVYVQPIDQHNIVISDTYTLSPTTINEIRVGFHRGSSTQCRPLIGAFRKPKELGWLTPATPTAAGFIRGPNPRSIAKVEYAAARSPRAN